MTNQITPAEVRVKLERGDDFVLLDVREPWEHAQRSIPQAVLIPLGTLSRRLDELDPGKAIVAFCKAGVRSEQACGLLRASGFKDVRNMTGGIDAWT